jgi:hypothetical protein
MKRLIARLGKAVKGVHRPEVESGWSYRATYCAQKGYPQLGPDRPQCKHLYLFIIRDRTP